MLKTALIAVAVVAVASPGLAIAKGAKKAEEAAQAPAGPIPYSQLAEEDAKLNGKPANHPTKRKAAKKAEDAAPAAAPAEAPKQ